MELIIQVAKYLKYMLEASRRNQVFDVEVFSTSGSKENIEALNDGRCDVAVIQHDATSWYRSDSANNPVDLRIVSKAYYEHAHLVCHRSLEVHSFADLEQLSKAGKATVFVGSFLSGGAMTIENLRALYPKDYANIIATPVEPILDSSQNIKFDATQASILAAINNKACAFFVTRAPYPFLNNNSISGINQLNIANIDDWKFNDLTDHDGNKIYDFIEFDKIPNTGSEELYKDLRKLSRFHTANTTLQLSADVVVNSAWEGDMIASLQLAGRSGSAQRWRNTIDKIGVKQGDFSQLGFQLKSITVLELPAE